jgi:ubiquinone/menaquinone biosynthesis C-methylase UbiE
MKEYWNQRYNASSYIYGKAPNEFFAEQLGKVSPGSVLLPCEGEGRNAVFAASLGWEVIAFDQSESGQQKAMALANEKGVSINYGISDAMDFELPDNRLDMVAFIYAHFPASIRSIIHRKAIDWLKPGGLIIVEAFDPQQLNNSSGGPKELEMLYTEAMLITDFELLNIELIQSCEIELNEGDWHRGKANVIRFVGKKR